MYYGEHSLVRVKKKRDMRDQLSKKGNVVGTYVGVVVFWLLGNTTKNREALLQVFVHWQTIFVR